MSGDYGAIAIAIVGVFGTLAAPIVSQRLSRRARQDEFEMQRKTQQDQRRHEGERLKLENKRACYVALLANARHYRMELMNYLYAAQDESRDSVDRSQLEDARRAYVTSFAEAQLTASTKVLRMIEPFNFGLSKAYAATSYPGDEIPDPTRSLNEVENLLRQLWDQQWDNMRAAMRQDIGVTD